MVGLVVVQVPVRGEASLPPYSIHPCSRVGPMDWEGAFPRGPLRHNSSGNHLPPVAPALAPRTKT